MINLFSYMTAAAAIILLVGYTLIKVSRSTILVCNIIINLLWAIHYLLLGANTGSICSLFCALMVAVFSAKNKVGFLSHNYIPVIFGTAFLAGGIWTYNRWTSVIPIFGNILLVIAMWLDEEVLIKGFCIPVGLLWILYNFICGSWIGVVGQAFAVIANIVYLILFFKEQRREKNYKKES